MKRVTLSAFEIAALWAVIKNARDNTADNARARETQRNLSSLSQLLLEAEEVTLLCRS